EEAPPVRPRSRLTPGAGRPAIMRHSIARRSDVDVHVLRRAARAQRRRLWSVWTSHRAGAAADALRAAAAAADGLPAAAAARRSAAVRPAAAAADGGWPPAAARRSA